MKSFAILSLAAAAVAMPQAASPEGCSSSADGSFQITTVNVTSDATKRGLQRRQLSGVLTLSLEDGILKDQAGRTGYIASNYQFQFDAPVQEGARETSGFGLCSNNSLSLGGTTVWYQCLSGDFYNLYSQSTGAQCIPIHIVAVNEGSASQLPDGQPQAPTGVSQISDGQPQATAPAPAISQISDGQPQASAPAVISQISDGQPQASAPAVISQISDGQPQASAPAVVSQISDGQPQASAPVANATVSRPALPEFTGAAATSTVAAGALVAGLFGLFALL